MNHKLNIIIPTKDRAETLIWAINSCLQNKYSHFSIIVSDNASTDNTEEVVMSFRDPRITYLKTPFRMSMTANWEFALKHVKEGYVTVLGDDDGFLPNSFHDINEMLNRHPSKAISWKQSFYRWPNNDFVRLKNLLQVPFKVGFEMRKSHIVLNKVIDQQMFPGDLPWLYGGFVSMDCIQEVKDKSNGVFFHSKIPDIYSAMVLSSIIDEYLFSYTPYSIAGHSAKSNGAAQIQKNANEILSNDIFLKESTDFPWHPKLEFVHVYPFIIWESILQAMEVGIFTPKVKMDYQQLFDKGVQHCVQLGIIETERNKLEIIASKNILVFKNRKYFNKIWWLILNLKHYIHVWSNNAFYMCINANVTNVLEASVFQYSLVRPSWIGMIFNNLSLLLKLV